MTTSGAYTVFTATVTRDAIASQAMKNIGKLDPYETISPVDMQDCTFQLNLLCKQRMGRSDGAQGLKVWTRRHGHLFLSGSTGRYSVGPTATGWTENYFTSTAASAAAAAAATLDAVNGDFVLGQNIGIELSTGNLQWTTISGLVVGTTTTVTLAAVGGLTASVNAGARLFMYATTAQQPLKIETAVLRDTDSNDVPVRIIPNIGDYDILPQKANPTNQSDPTAIYYEFQLGNSYLYTDCGAAADVTKHLAMSYLEPIQDMNSALDNLEYPAEYYLALVWLLSEQIAPMFFKVWTPNMERLKDEAVAIAFHKDVEVVTMYFQPGEE